MVTRNPSLKNLGGSYLFPEIQRRVRAFQEEHPEAELISLGIGDTTEPLTAEVVAALQRAAKKMGESDGYAGYGPEAGLLPLRKKISEVIYGGAIDPDEIFISDGSKCDIGRLQLLFGSNVRIAVQDPTYPVYVDGSVIAGAAGPYLPPKKGYDNVVYLPCLPENDFFPDLSNIPPVDVIYFCTPNNPTGAVATQKQLEELIAYAQENGIFLVVDTAYSAFIRDPALPKTIFFSEQAKEVALESGSFSKMAGFTGLRLGWTVVPKALRWDDGSAVHADWQRIQSTVFNGASRIIQEAGCEVLSHSQPAIEIYLARAKALRDLFVSKGYRVYGGEHVPYLWVHFPGKSSWEVFDFLLSKGHLITTPGVGFGPSGEHFVRFSAFAAEPHFSTALEYIKDIL